MELTNARVLVTGATGGIGEAIAVACAARGAHVVVSGRRAEPLAELAERVGGTAVVADLADADGVRRLLDEAGEVDVVVANAALPGSGDLLDYSVEQIDRALDINLRTPILLARLAGARMAARGSGHLVFINSVAGKVASAQASLYNATKFGLRGFAQALTQDMSPRGVGVTSIYPGFIRDAGMFAKSGAQLPPGVGTRTPQDVANAVVKAVEQNLPELSVASTTIGVGALIAQIAPRFAARVQRLGGGDKVLTQLTAGQRDMR